MNFKSILIAFFVIAIQTTYSQNKKHFTFSDIETGRSTYLSVKGLSDLQWVDDTTFLFVRNDSIVLYSISNKWVKSISLEKIKSYLPTEEISGNEEYTELYFYSDSIILLQSGNEIVGYNQISNEVHGYAIPDTAENVIYNSSNGIFAFTLENNLAYLNKENNVVWISSDVEKWIVNGQIVHREEFGIDRGVYWSPDGNKLAYYKNNQTKVSKYPLVDTDNSFATSNNIAYPTAGNKSEEVSVWVYNTVTKSNIKLNVEGDPEQYLTNISWNSNSEHIYIQQLNRKQDSMVMVSYAASTGKITQTLFSEINERYVEPQFPITFSQKNENDFYYLSRRDGFNHLYKYHSKKGKLVQLTSGAWEVIDFYGYDPSEESLFFLANKEDVKSECVYKYDLEKGETILLSWENGVHEPQFNSLFNVFLDSYSSYTIPGNVEIINNQGVVQQTLLKAESPLQDYRTTGVERGTIKSADNQWDLNYALVRPIDMNEGEKYPLVIYLYGGPHVQLLKDQWSDRVYYWQQYLAQHGIASFRMDCRGSGNRGSEFESVIHRQNGIPQLEDHREALRFIKNLDFVDTNRLGIHGWSFGGYMTIQMMLKNPDDFKVGVAGGPVVDWSKYEVMYGERYMDTPQENPEGYAQTNLNNYVDSLSGKLLIIHGAQDPVVLWQHSLEFVRTCIKKNKQVDYFVYPTHEHNVRGKDRRHLTEKITSYLLDNL